MIRLDPARRGLKSAFLTLAAISWVLSAVAGVGALLIAALTLVFGPLAVLLWVEHHHPSAVPVEASVLVAVATAGMLIACWRRRAAKRGRWVLPGASFAVGQIVLLSLSWRDRTAVPPWLAGLPASTIALLFVLAVCSLAWFALLWGDGKGFGT